MPIRGVSNTLILPVRMLVALRKSCGASTDWLRRSKSITFSSTVLSGLRLNGLRSVGGSTWVRKWTAA